MNSQIIKSPATGCTQSEAHIKTTMPRDNTPIYPAVDSLHGRLLARLLSHLEVTYQTHLRECGSSSLADAVYKLRHTYHWPVTMNLRNVSNRDKINDTSTIGFYSLPTKAIELAGAGGRSFIKRVAVFELKAQGGAA